MNLSSEFKEPNHVGTRAKFVVFIAINAPQKGGRSPVATSVL
jgi:hypothetical protein